MFYLYLDDHSRVETACFPYDLSPDDLRGVISDLRRAGHGLERWIAPGLEHNQGISAIKDDHPDTYAILPELLESVRDLPVADPWQRTRRELQRGWAEHLSEHPEDLAKVPAPWLIPNVKGSRGAPGRKPGKVITVRKRRAGKTSSRW